MHSKCCNIREKRPYKKHAGATNSFEREGYFKYEFSFFFYGDTLIFTCWARTLIRRVKTFESVVTVIPFAPLKNFLVSWIWCQIICTSLQNSLPRIVSGSCFESKAWTHARRAGPTCNYLILSWINQTVWFAVHGGQGAWFDEWHNRE